MQQPVATQQGRSAHNGQPLEGLEHVQLEPVAGVEAENGAQSKVETWKKTENLGKKFFPKITIYYFVFQQY